MRLHRIVRTRLFNLYGVNGGPNFADIEPSWLSVLYSTTGGKSIIDDTWDEEQGETAGLREQWTGFTIFVEKGHNDEVDIGLLALGRDRASLFDVDRSQPYSGEAPPRPPSGGASQFIRNKRGVWCRLDTLARLIPVDELGERWQQDRHGKWTPQMRPSSLTREYWDSLTYPERRGGGRNVMRLVNAN